MTIEKFYFLKTELRNAYKSGTLVDECGSFMSPE